MLPFRQGQAGGAGEGEGPCVGSGLVLTGVGSVMNVFRRWCASTASCGKLNSTAAPNVGSAD